MRTSRVLSHRARVVAVLGCSCLILRSQGTDAPKTFKSQSHGYTVQYPSDWYPHVVSDVFYIESFPPSRAVQAERLPQDGAAIKILVPSQIITDSKRLPGTLDELAKAGVGRRAVVEKRIREVGVGSKKISVIEVRTQCCGAPPYEESLEWYFELDGRMFMATLTRRQGGGESDRLQEVLEKVVLSLRVAVRNPAE